MLENIRSVAALNSHELQVYKEIMELHFIHDSVHLFLINIWNTNHGAICSYKDYNPKAAKAINRLYLLFQSHQFTLFNNYIGKSIYHVKGSHAA